MNTRQAAMIAALGATLPEGARLAFEGEAEAAAKKLDLVAATSKPKEKRYGLDTGVCVCGRTISKNKDACKACKDRHEQIRQEAAVGRAEGNIIGRIGDPDLRP